MPIKGKKDLGAIGRALQLMRGQRLRKYTGSDISELQRKVADYYKSHEGSSYYSQLAKFDQWKDTSRRTGFLDWCRS